MEGKGGRQQWRAGQGLSYRRSWRGGRRAGAGGRRCGGQAALLRCSGNGGCSATGRRGQRQSVLFGSVAPRIMARQALSRQRSAIPVAVASALCHATIHDAAQAFGHTRTIDVAKNVSLKKSRGLDLKLVSKKY